MESALNEVGGNVGASVNDQHGYNTKAGLSILVLADKLGVRIAGVASERCGNDVRDIVNSQAPSGKIGRLRAPDGK